MLKEASPPKIYTDSIHYLDFGAYPSWLNRLFSSQKASHDVQGLAKHLLEKINPTDGVGSRLRKIQQYLHDHTYHITPDDRLKLYGYVEFESIPYPQDMLNDAYATIGAALFARSRPEEAHRRLQENKRKRRFVGSRNGPFEKSLDLQDSFRGKPPLQCAEEATLAAALSLYVANVSEDNVVFIGSPVHVVTFIRPSQALQNGCLFDSKMLYFPNDIKKFGGTPEERKERYMGLFGKPWFIVNSSGFLNLQSGINEISEDNNKQIVGEIDHFFGLNS